MASQAGQVRQVSSGRSDSMAFPVSGLPMALSHGKACKQIPYDSAMGAGQPVFRWSADTEYMTVAECVAVAWSVAVAGYGPLLIQAPVTVRASGPWSVPVPVTIHVPGAGCADCHEAD